MSAQLVTADPTVWWVACCQASKNVAGSPPGCKVLQKSWDKSCNRRGAKKVLQGSKGLREHVDMAA